MGYKGYGFSFGSGCDLVPHRSQRVHGYKDPLFGSGLSGFVRSLDFG